MRTLGNAATSGGGGSQPLDLRVGRVKIAFYEDLDQVRAEMAALGELVATLRAELDQVRSELVEARAELTRLRHLNGLRDTEEEEEE